MTSTLLARSAIVRGTPSNIQRHPVVAGAVIGLGWGIAMRAWMRFIALNPEFSWSGTIFILGASVVVGTLLGFARARRLAGGVGWWRYSALSLGLLGAGGAVMWPSVILGALAIGRPRPKFMRLAVAAAAVAAQIPVLSSVINDNWQMSGLAAAVTVLWYAPMITLEAWGFSVAFAPSVEGARKPRTIERVLMTLPLLVAAGFGAIAIGLGG